MPVYDYECGCGAREERSYSIDSFPRTIRCSACGSRARKVMSIRGNKYSKDGGGVQDEHPSWLPDTIAAVQDVEAEIEDGNRPIESRSDLKRWLEKTGFEPKC